MKYTASFQGEEEKMIQAIIDSYGRFSRQLHTVGNTRIQDPIFTLEEVENMRSTLCTLAEQSSRLLSALEEALAKIAPSEGSPGDCVLGLKPSEKSEGRE